MLQEQRTVEKIDHDHHQCTWPCTSLSEGQLWQWLVTKSSHPSGPLRCSSNTLQEPCLSRWNILLLAIPTNKRVLVRLTYVYQRMMSWYTRAIQMSLSSRTSTIPDPRWNDTLPYLNKSLEKQRCTRIFQHLLYTCGVDMCRDVPTPRPTSKD